VAPFADVIEDVSLRIRLLAGHRSGFLRGARGIRAQCDEHGWRAQMQPVVASQPAKQASRQSPVPSWDERVRAALDEANAQAAIESERMIANYLREREAAKKNDSKPAALRDEAVDQVESAPPSLAKPSSALGLAELRRDHQAAQEARMSNDESANDLHAAASTPETTSASDGPSRTTPKPVRKSRRRKRESSVTRAFVQSSRRVKMKLIPVSVARNWTAIGPSLTRNWSLSGPFS
jgi:hypothetical protein